MLQTPTGVAGSNGLLPARARGSSRVRLAAAADRRTTTAPARALRSSSSRTTPTATSSTYQNCFAPHVPVARVKRRRRQHQDERRRRGRPRPGGARGCRRPTSTTSGRSSRPASDSMAGMIDSILAQPRRPSTPPSSRTAGASARRPSSTRPLRRPTRSCSSWRLRECRSSRRLATTARPTALGSASPTSSSTIRPPALRHRRRRHEPQSGPSSETVWGGHGSAAGRRRRRRVASTS